MTRRPGRAAFPALGTTAEVLVTDGSAVAVAEALLRAVLDELDAACSRFRSDSELCAVNRAAGTPASAGPLLRAAVTVALIAADQTDGDVTPTLGRHLGALGYDRDLAALPPDGPAGRAVAPDPRAWRRVAVDDAAGTVTVPTGVALDLGATAKAFGADRAAVAVAARAGCGVCVNLGGDLATAGPVPPGGWRVRVRERTGAGEHAQTVAIEGGALATSSTLLRRWTRGGVAHHHILDPRTGQPVRPHWRTVTVTAGSCVAANTASTAAVVRGAAAPGWLAAAGLPARLVAVDGAVQVVGGWPAGAAA